MSTEFTKTGRGASLLERIFIRSMVVLLKIEGNCSCLRAKVAHMVGHLPAPETGHLVINNFSLKSIESYAGNLDNVLQQWLTWQ
jgi:hypothetical protein